MRTVKIWLVGSVAGSSTALLFFLVTEILSYDGSLDRIELGIALITPAIVAILVAKATKSKVVILLVVTYLTLVMPVFGALFGAPDTSVRTGVTLGMLGFIGGLVWSTPFALWSLARRRKVN